ncbi:hypothetical protein ABI59_04305 [Acidobacteria bacterium Mor1]|nr:hypothetical protein ABI59_04305 [Acidobacteria bacterium Mor1]
MLLIACTLLAGMAPATAAEGKAERIDLNKASAEQLVTLPGVGPAIAKRIVAFREENGPFKRVEDLLKVRGVGEKSFQKIKGRVRVGAIR